MIDPLLTRPMVLDEGSVLPGDAYPPPCLELTVWDRASEREPLSLSRAVDLALCHNPQVKSAWAAIKVQASALGEARAAYLPTVSASASRVTDQTSYPGSKTASTTLHSNTKSANLNWRLFDFGGRDANLESANALLLAAIASHDAVLQKLLSNVITAYFDAQTAQTTVVARRKNESLAKQILDASRRREVRGAGSQTDTLQAGTALAKAALELSRAQGASHKALASLVYALGLPIGAQPVLAEDLLDTENRMRQVLDHWLAETRAHHPILVAARAQLQSAKEKVAANHAEGLPTVDLTGSFFENGRPNQSLTTTKTQETMLGVTLNIPIFDGFSRTYKVRAAQAHVEQKEAELQENEQQVLLEVVKAHAEASAALENLAASQKLLSAAQEAVSSMQRKFDRGAADILEILNTQTALSDAQQERIRCLADWRAARLKLFSTAGQLGRGTVGQWIPIEGKMVPGFLDNAVESVSEQ
ncbi:MAG: TolC family protein [Magnetococcales bacterium]|nr:TolC family protein [Magnetococcales bacterium]MBF0116720.1 TolC family protein [Magnetococcales bacterium]